MNLVYLLINAVTVSMKGLEMLLGYGYQINL